MDFGGVHRGATFLRTRIRGSCGRGGARLRRESSSAGCGVGLRLFRVRGMRCRRLCWWRPSASLCCREEQIRFGSNGAAVEALGGEGALDRRGLELVGGRRQRREWNSEWNGVVALVERLDGTVWTS